MDPSLFLADLEQKPAVLSNLADAIDRGAMEWQFDRPPERVLLLGMGSSLSAALTAAHRMRAAGVMAVAETGAAEIAMLCGSHDLVVGISAGGTSVETNRLFAASAAGRRVAVTNAPDSPITSGATSVIDLLAGVEAGGVACRTFAHTIVALLALEHRLAGTCPDLATTVRRAAAAITHLLDRRGEWLARASDLLAGPHGTWILAPAERQSSAAQGALMLRECPRRNAVACETGDWSHVDVYLTKTLDYRALVHPGSRWDAQAADWLTQRASTVVAVGADFPNAQLTIRYPGDDDGAVALLAETIVIELVAADLWSNSVGADDLARG
jgi:glucosamine--fructose-6-phosphate aminotransferase (isomerizing)